VVHTDAKHLQLHRVLQQYGVWEHMYLLYCLVCVVYLWLSTRIDAVKT
jgi:hypothetical protein